MKYTEYYTIAFVYQSISSLGYVIIVKDEMDWYQIGGIDTVVSLNSTFSENKSTLENNYLLMLSEIHKRCISDVMCVRVLVSPAGKGLNKGHSNTRRSANAGLMLGQHCRRWDNIKPALVQRIVFVGDMVSA